LFGSIGIPELIVIMVVALIVIGPKKLPEMAKSLGRALRDFKRATSDFQDNLNLDIDDSSSDYNDSISESAKEEQTPRPPGSGDNTIAPPGGQAESGQTGTTGSSTGPGDPKDEPPKERAEKS